MTAKDVHQLAQPESQDPPGTSLALHEARLFSKGLRNMALVLELHHLSAQSQTHLEEEFGDYAANYPKK